MNEMMFLFIFILVINAAMYAWVLFAWHKDCKLFGKDELAVPLKRRLWAAFLCITLPCMLGFITRRP